MRRALAAQAVELTELRKENARFKEDRARSDGYFREWKQRFSYPENVSFDKVLENLYFDKFGKKPY